MGAMEGKATMRRVIVFAITTALFLSVAAGLAVAAPWVDKAEGGMVASDAGHAGLAIDLAVTTAPKPDNYTAARGQGEYSYNGNIFRLRVTHACVNAAEHTVTAWGPATVRSGSFDVPVGGPLVKTDRAYAVLSLLDNADGTVSARAGIAADFFDGGVLPTMIAENCEWPLEGAFPATGAGELDFTTK